VIGLPPKERACVLLKDVFDYTLEEIAELVDSTPGGVKAALSRGRQKLTSLPKDSGPPGAASQAMSQLLQLYVDRFNRRDWDGLRELISADARLQVADRFAGRLSDSPYFGRYERMGDWRMAVGDVDGQAAIVSLRADGDRWVPQAVVRLDIVDRQVVGVVDYHHCPWVLANARAVGVDPASVSPAAVQP
jgi:RNA polymerase sigma-70 factor (ECF subfamily)